MKRFAIEVGAILLIGFLALTFGGCTKPTDPTVVNDLVWIPSLDAHGQPIVDTLWADYYKGPSGEMVHPGPVVRPRGAWCPRSSRIIDDSWVTDTMRDTTER